MYSYSTADLPKGLYKTFSFPFLFFYSSQSATLKTNLGKNSSQFRNFFPFCLTLLRSSHYAKLVHFLFSTVKALLNADEERIQYVH